MASAPKIAMLVAALLALFLWLSTLIGCLGETAPPEVHGPTASSVPVPVPAPTPAAPVSTRHLEAVEDKLLELTNAERRKEGGPNLKREDDLRAVARGHNADMLNRRFFSHVSPDGDGPGERVANRHRRLVGGVGENIWQSTGLSSDDADALARLIVKGWMGSEGHRRNMLDENYTHLGAGVSQAGDEIRATLVFGDVWGYLDADLPPSVRRGTSLDLVVKPSAGRGKVDMFDLFAKGITSLGPNPLSDGRIDVEPGLYQLRLYFPQDGGSSYRIVDGPQVEVAP